VCVVTRVLVPLLAVLALAGCGVPVDDSPRALERPAPPYGSEAPASPRIGTVVERLYWVRDGKLVAVPRRVQEPRSPQQMVADLEVGPTAAEQQQGYTSALSTMTVMGTTVARKRASVEIGPPSSAGTRSDEQLAYAQIVCTLTGRAEVGTVSFTRDGQPLAVPQGEGALTTAPLTIADYANLIGS
jgi:Sporulation and spore germination